MDLGFETIGNATLIVHDRQPVLVSDPWIKGPAYFGSWTLSHEIPDQQAQAVASAPYVWLSHGHPDHLSFESLEQMRDKTLLLPDHFGARIVQAQDVLADPLEGLPAVDRPVSLRSQDEEVVLVGR